MNMSEPGAQHPLIADIEREGLHPAETLTGIFTLGPEGFGAPGPIGNDYCWMHTPGGWTCEICAREQGVIDATS